MSLKILHRGKKGLNGLLKGLYYAAIAADRLVLDMERIELGLSSIGTSQF